MQESELRHEPQDDEGLRAQINREAPATPLNPNIDRSVFKITHSAAFSCQYCGQGGQTFEATFPDGVCPHCGAGAAKCDEKVFVDTLRHLDESFFVVFADDTKAVSQQLVADLQAKDAHVITLEDLMPNGMSTDQIPFVLQTVAVKAPWIILVPSKQFAEESEGRDDLILDVVFSQIIRGKPKKITPAFVSREYLDFAPYLMSGRLGFFLDDDSEQYVAYKKSWFLDQVPELIAKMKKP